MKYENIKKYSEESFRRVTGVKKSTFVKMVEILNDKYAEEHSKNIRKSGRKPKLCMEEKLLATLEYLREYRSLAISGQVMDLMKVTSNELSNGLKTHLLMTIILNYPAKRPC